MKSWMSDKQVSRAATLDKLATGSSGPNAEQTLNALNTKKVKNTSLYIRNIVKNVLTIINLEHCQVFNRFPVINTHLSCPTEIR